jgi:NAD(P)-dependent dehydrogenase (short-subunit alcohol dehydrogenase family)
VVSRPCALVTGAANGIGRACAEADPAADRAALAASVPLGRLSTPGECAAVVAFLASAAASYVTGAALPVDVGFTAR